MDENPKVDETIVIKRTALAGINPEPAPAEKTPSKRVKKDATPPLPVDTTGLTEEGVKIFKYLSKVTAPLREEPEESVTLSPKAKKLQAIMDKSKWLTDLGQVEMCKILAILTDEPIVSKAAKMEVPVKAGVVLVPVKNSNGSDYRLNVPTMVVREGRVEVQAFRMDYMTEGNNLRKTDCRGATDEEIVTYIKGVGVDKIVRILNIIVV